MREISVREKIKKTKPFQSGEDFSVPGMSRSLAIDEKCITATIPSMLERGDIERARARMTKGVQTQYYRKRAGNHWLRVPWTIDKKPYPEEMQGSQPVNFSTEWRHL